MEKQQTIAIALIVFITLGFILYKSLGSYVRKAYGKKWLQAWGNKVYFWQALVLTSTLSTALVMLFLKWNNLLIF
ncbi:hypothetical protein [Flagellimonas meridianipacifica]|uniref:Uncharacterized protein n=1 Tax=Flagellimonas meridianipacifica TaxID=1080225 RepID=A0A2T0MBB1_9FLAO|nr:hypothetical protein [Allomuricauda pacifica]PRX54786.1 hypothetical protein CLV81_3190 [Allomuricauda pacifica]